jgi:seryl-tRNA synthetase
MHQVQKFLLLIRHTMLDMQYIRENIDTVKQNIQNRRMNVDIDKLIQLDEQRRDQQTKLDNLRAEKNK